MQLPPGFVLDDGIQAAAPPGLPPGFVLDGAQPQKPAFSGSILPFSRDAQGDVSFDSNAGIVGAIKRAVTLPQDVMTGKVQLPSAGGAVPGSVEPTDPGAQEAIGRVTEAATIMSPVGTAAQAGSRAIPGFVKPPAPSAEALKEASSAGYKSARDMGVDIAAAPVANMAQQVIRGLEHDGRIAAAAPKTHRILSELANPPEGAFHTIQTLEGARRALGDIAGNFKKPTDQGAAKVAIGRLDELLSGLSDESVLAGSATAANRAIQDARANWAAAQRSENITGRVYKAERRAEAANSGQNIDNPIRQRLVDLLTSKEQRAGYTPQEIAQIEALVKGSKTGNALRVGGNALGGGGGLGAAVTAGGGAAMGAALGGPVGGVIGATAPIAGAGMKKLANALTRRKAESLDEATRKRSPLYQNAPEVPRLANLSAGARAALIRSLMTTVPHEGRTDPRTKALIDALTR